MSNSRKIDDLLEDRGPAALVIRTILEPDVGREGVFFPATFAAAQGNAPDRFPGGYNIDTFPDQSNVCLVDSVGSQANRIEPIFAGEGYRELVPQVTIKAGDKSINLLDAGHRAADAIVRRSGLKEELHAAFKEVLKGNAEPLAKIAPTSLVFGVWDSRDTEVKLPRLVASTIRAFNVNKLSRSANYLVQQQIDYTKEGQLPIWESEKEKELYSGRCFLNALATASHGGVMLKANGLIRRDATLSLAALRRLSALDDEKTRLLQCYILGLALVALTAEQETDLRQGCNLVPAGPGESGAVEIVHANGKREPWKFAHEDARRFAEFAAKQFGVGKDREVLFDKKLAMKEIKGDSEKLKGEVMVLDLAEKKFKLNIGKKNEPQEIEVITAESTVFTKGKDDSTFESVVVAGARLDIELAGGVAVKVMSKK